MYDVEAINMQFHGYHSYFRENFQMLLTAKEGEIQFPHHSLGQSATPNKKTIDFKNLKKIDH